ncbi:hypothetical protein [Halorubrum sp. ARQ200]|uniref:hypothetical protein n=1 Tax=Halorubrum sp. ARQ200 TaxID=1855872 RepID=UPI0013052526|nr:hypothetical protein [Halorubrum sp. ARQ200]
MFDEAEAEVEPKNLRFSQFDEAEAEVEPKNLRFSQFDEAEARSYSIAEWVRPRRRVRE